MPRKAEIVQNFARSAALGLGIHITELDMRVPQPATPEHARQQAEDYRDIIEVCLDAEACEMVVTWGFTDADSWIPRAFPGYGGALLLDANYQPKPAYRALTALLSKAR